MRPARRDLPVSKLGIARPDYGPRVCRAGDAALAVHAENERQARPAGGALGRQLSGAAAGRGWPLPPGGGAAPRPQRRPFPPFARCSTDPHGHPAWPRLSRSAQAPRHLSGKRHSRAGPSAAVSIVKPSPAGRAAALATNGSNVSPPSVHARSEDPSLDDLTSGYSPVA